MEQFDLFHDNLNRALEDARNQRRLAETAFAKVSAPTDRGHSEASIQITEADTRIAELKKQIENLGPK